jgi:uncharacterized membrane protein YcaP (DUF421 family)
MDLFFRALLIYIVLWVGTRLVGKRTLGELSLLHLLLLLLMVQVGQPVLVGNDGSLTNAVSIFLVLLGVHAAFSFFEKRWSLWRDFLTEKWSTRTKGNIFSKKRAQKIPVREGRIVRVP